MKTTINAILVDDEPGSLITLGGLLERFCPEVNILAASGNPLEAIELIKAKKPNLVFLDIEMPYANAFDVLDRIAPVDFQVVFVTAFSEYAIKAFKYAALDYLLKPLNIDELKVAVERVKNTLITNPKGNIRVAGLLDNLKHPSDNPEKLSIYTSVGFELINVSDIICFEAEGAYSQLILRNRQKLFVSRGLKDFEESLSPRQFVRVHHSFLVNLSHVKRYINGRGGQVEMTNGLFIEVSVRRKAEFREKFKGKF